jgi:hypothetical protein
MPLTLADYHIASSFRPFLPAGNTHDVCSYETIQLVLEKGARMLWIDVWSSNSYNYYDNTAYPIVRAETLMNKYGEALDFDKVCKVIRKHAWDGTNYPLILYLDIHNTAKQNRFVLEKIAESIYDSFADKLVDKRYGFARYNIAQVPITKIWGKVIIITNTYPLEGNLNEFVNGVISADIQNSGTLLVYDKAHLDYGGVLSKEPNTEDIVHFNKTHLSIVRPIDTHALSNMSDPGSDLLQIPFKDPFKYGYSCVMMNYQQPGKLRAEYIEKFKEAPFVIKDQSLRNIPKCQPKKKEQNKLASYAPRRMDYMNGFFTHKY